MRFGVLGPISAWTDGGAPVKVPELKVRALLASLMVHAGRVRSVDGLVDDLWGDRLPDNPANALQGKVSQLRRALERSEPGGRRLVVSRAPGYLLDVEHDAVDAGRFAALTAQARATDDPGAKSELMAAALDLWRGPAFADFADQPFAQALIAKLTEDRLQAVEDRAEARLALGEHKLLVSELGDLVTQYPDRERLRAAQLRALYGAGRQREALDSYEDLRRHLADDLGLDPSTELAALHQAILRQDPALTVAPAERPRGNLPVSLTTLIGRDEAREAVREQLETGRLVTLTGTGGVGKTRLALATAEGFAGGAWLVELAGIAPATDAASLAGTVMKVLDIREDAARTPVEQLGDALRDKRFLLVLDNCEHVLEPVAALAEALLRAALELRILATSRQPLGLSGERIWSVPPLESPTAVRLFAARAGITVDADNAEAVEALCLRLDGIPLALELAAARVRTLGVHGLLARLDDRFAMLAGGYRDAPERQRTLRAVIDWSWELLPDSERIVLRRLAVHAEGSTLDAAETVCAGEGVQPGDVLDLLAGLVDRSLVVLVDRAEGPRYRLLESIKDYCVERLREAGEFTEIQQRHRRYYTELAVRAEPMLRGAAQRHWLERLDADNANLLRAFELALQEPADSALRLVNALAWYWILRGRLAEARRALRLALAESAGASAVEKARARTWEAGIALLHGDSSDRGGRMNRALAQYDEVDDPAGQAAACWFLAMAQMGIDLAAGEDLANRALTVCTDLDDRWGAATAHSLLARHALARSDLAAVRSHGERSAALFDELGDRWGRLQTVFPLASLAEIAGDYPQALRRYQDGLRLAEDLGLWPDAIKLRTGLGRLALLDGDYAAAWDHHECAYRLAGERHFHLGEAEAELGLGLIARRQGRLDTAEAHLRRMLDWFRQVDFGPAITLVLAELGFLAEQRGDAAAALGLHLDGFAHAQKLGDPRAVALALEGLAGAKAADGRHRDAAVLLGTASSARESVSAPLPPAERGDVDRIATAVRKALGDQAFTEEFTRGSTLLPDQAPTF